MAENKIPKVIEKPSRSVGSSDEYLASSGQLSSDCLFLHHRSVSAHVHSPLFLSNLGNPAIKLELIEGHELNSHREGHSGPRHRDDQRAMPLIDGCRRESFQELSLVKSPNLRKVSHAIKIVATSVSVSRNDSVEIATNCLRSIYMHSIRASTDLVGGDFMHFFITHNAWPLSRKCGHRLNFGFMQPWEHIYGVLYIVMIGLGGPPSLCIMSYSTVHPDELDVVAPACEKIVPQKVDQAVELLTFDGEEYCPHADNVGPSLLEKRGIQKPLTHSFNGKPSGNSSPGGPFVRESRKGHPKEEALDDGKVGAKDANRYDLRDLHRTHCQLAVSRRGGKGNLKADQSRTLKKYDNKQSQVQPESPLPKIAKVFKKFVGTKKIVQQLEKITREVFPDLEPGERPGLSPNLPPLALTLLVNGGLIMVRLPAPRRSTQPPIVAQLFWRDF
ncbi:hypothetical protein B0H16DRAFT_1474626 [Mycena metata]|uniref:Uncharacterized protein n=1 Tax=Mycena metata TaxID=1033252 RepID=A0AAD7HGN5_9AGAR|nr:hypothetical protein B0H16DRAFT_1474626 [Mycena metata]